MFGKRLTLFTILGFTVRVDASWLLIAVLITWSLAKELFPLYLKDLPQIDYWLMGIAGTIGLFLSVIFHELSHSLVARRFGMQMHGITLFLFGGVAEAYEEPKSPKTEFLMAIAGPLSSVVLSGFLFIAATAASFLAFPAPVLGVLIYLGSINILLALFNLLPGFPLDGGRVLRSAIWHFKGDLMKATRIATWIGSGIGILFILLGVYSLLIKAVISGIWWILIGLFLRNAALSSLQRLELQQAMGSETVRHFMNPNPVTVAPETTIRQFIENYAYRHYHKMYPVVREGYLIGCLITSDIQYVPQSEWDTKLVSDFMHQCTMDNTIGPDDWVFNALNAMGKTGIGRLMVVDRGKLLGVLTLNDLAGYFSARMQFGGK
jgi:Zn-dependent protease/CBS domain-containing protein